MAGLSPSSDPGIDVKIVNQLGSVMIEPSRMHERLIIRIGAQSSVAKVRMQHDGCGPLNWRSLGASQADESCPDGMMIFCMAPLKES